LRWLETPDNPLGPDAAEDARAFVIFIAALGPATLTTGKEIGDGYK
jgi:hypothetical protein